MKNYLKLGILFLGILFFQNCSKDDDLKTIEQEVLAKKDFLDDENLLEYLEQRGFSKNQIINKEGYYIVDGDMVFTKGEDYYNKKNILNSNNLGKHYTTASGPLAWSNVKYFINSNVTGNWDDATIAAANEWSSICGVNITQTTNISEADFEVKFAEISSFSTPNNTYAQGNVGGNNGPGNFIQINYNNPSIDIPNFNLIGAIKVMTHEMGHVLTFGHTDAGPIYFNIVPGTELVSDPSSIMSGGVSFSQWDIFAARYLFPLPPPPPSVTISGPTYMAGNVNMVAWNYTGNIPNVQNITWWYKKVNGPGSPVLIASGTTAYFIASSDTFYSDTILKTSNFQIYIKVVTTTGVIYTSSNYNILKKGKFKLEGGI